MMFELIGGVIFVYRTRDGYGTSRLKGGTVTAIVDTFTNDVGMVDQAVSKNR
jgi:hypothetical protein